MYIYCSAAETSGLLYWFSRLPSGADTRQAKVPLAVIYCNTSFFPTVVQHVLVRAAVALTVRYSLYIAGLKAEAYTYAHATKQTTRPTVAHRPIASWIIAIVLAGNGVGALHKTATRGEPGKAAKLENNILPCMIRIGSCATTVTGYRPSK